MKIKCCKQGIFLLFSFLMLFPLSAQTYTKEERLHYLSQLWKDVSTKFYDPKHLEQINWDSLYVSNIEKAVKAQKDLDYYSLLERMIAVLNDGHSELNTGQWLFSEDSDLDSLPIEIGLIGEDYFVLGIEKGKLEEIPLGSKIIEVNDLPIIDYLKTYIFPQIAAKTWQDKNRRALKNLVIGKINDSITFTIQTPDLHILKRVMKYNRGENNILRKDIEGTQFSDIKYRPNTNYYLDEDGLGKIFYNLRLDSFLFFQGRTSRFKSISELIRENSNNISQADYIVLDLRYNRGGSQLEADTLLSCFLNLDTLVTYPSLVRKDHAYYAAKGYGYPEYKEYYNNLVMDTLSPDTLLKKDLPFFSQPLFILISSKTYSAAEDLLITLKLHYPDRAIIVGTPTGGSTGLPFVRKLPYHDAYYRICVRLPLLPNGLFDNGIRPDYFYEPNIDEQLGNDDLIFQYVEKLYTKLYSKN